MSDIGRIAVQLYTFRREFAQDMAGTLARIGELGVEGVEVVAGADWLPAAPELRRQLDAHGLVVCAAHTRLPEGPGAEAVLDEQEALGNDTLVVPTLDALAGCARGDLGNEATLDAVVERFDAAARVAAGRGMRVGYHNHWWEWEGTVDGRPGYDAFWARVDPAVIAEVDVYWAEVAGQRPAEVIERLGERAQLLHVKDGPLERDEPMVAVGDGSADVTGALDAAAHARWSVIELDDCAGDVFDAVAASARWLSRRRG